MAQLQNEWRNKNEKKESNQKTSKMDRRKQSKKEGTPRL